jgi:hypothetical protein
MHLRRDLLTVLDPARFAATAGLLCDPWQQQVLRSSGNLLLCCSRQSGKSTVSAMLAAYTAVTRPRALILLISPSQRQSAELLLKCGAALRTAHTAPRSSTQNALRLTLANGSRIVSLPGRNDTIRGYSGVSLLVIDEAAWVPDDLYYAVRPMLAVSNGRIIAMSTPHGTRGWFFEAWSGSEAWERIAVPASACPRISPEFLAEEQRTLGHWWFAQEYECQFLAARSEVFRPEDIARAQHHEVEPWPLSPSV